MNAPLVAAGARPGGCGGWNSTTQPPDYIRVLRNHSGTVDRVPFRKYVVTVMGKEWPSYLPLPVIEAGAVAVKQFAWFHALGNGRMSRRGQCFDVTDGTGDQLYKPHRSRVRADHYAAVNATWGVRLLKNGTLFMTGYRSGNKGRCGHDATGWKLYARSAVRCASRGDSYLDILRIYYGPVAVVNGDVKNNDQSPGSMSVEMSPASASTATPAAAQTATPASALAGAPVLDVDAAPAAPAAAPLGERAFTTA